MNVTMKPITVPRQNTLEWTKIFPGQVTKNYSSSVKFMKQLTVVSISTIAYLRKAFFVDSYSTEPFGGLRVKILKKNCRDELAQFLSTSVSHAFEALDKRYLHQLAICFYEEECEAENLFEYYIFEYSYKGDGVTMNVRSQSQNLAHTVEFSFDEVHAATTALLRACFVYSNSCTEDLPSSYDLSVRLYYNKDAPEGYQAPGFHFTDSDDHLKFTLMRTTKLGRVNTPFHSMTARFYKEEAVPSCEAIPSQNAPIMTQFQEFDSEESNPATAASEFRLLCPCNKDESADINNVVLLTCHYCNTKQHAICFGVLPEDASKVKNHCCATCYDRDYTRNLTDPKLATLTTAKRRESITTFRRALMYCLQRPEISAKTLIEQLGMSNSNARKTIDTLALLGVIENVDPGSTLPRKINKEKLKVTLSSYFNRFEKDRKKREGNEGMVDRLLTEIFTQKEPEHDPIGSVLEPSEKVNLQNTSIVGRVIKNPVKTIKTTETEDVIMQQYKKAILANEIVDEGLPLSGPHNPVKDDDQIDKRPAKRKADDEKGNYMMKSGVNAKNFKFKKQKQY